MKKLLLLFWFLSCASFLTANEVRIEDFATQVNRLQETFSRGEQGNYVLSPVADEICREIAAVTILKAADRDYYVDFWWIRNVIDELNREISAKKRKLIFANLVDTLAGVLKDMQSEFQENGASKKEMHDALDRAMGRTREIQISGGAQVGESLQWAGGGSFVTDGDGDGISIISGDSGSGSVHSGGGYSGASSGSGSASGQRSTYSGSSSGSAGNYRPVSTNVAPTRISSGGQTNSPTQSATTPSSSHSVQQNGQTTSTPVSRPARVNQPAATPKPQPPKPQPPRPPRIPDPPKPPAKIADFIFYIILGICVTAMLIMIFLMLRKTRKKMVEEREEFARLESELPPERMKVETIYDKALQAAARGDFTEGIRLLTIGAMLLLEQHRVMNFQDTLTNGEYLRSLLRERSLYSMFKEPMGLFDLLIYGLRQPGEVEFEKFRKFYLELEKVQR